MDVAKEMVDYANKKWDEEARKELNLEFLHIPALSGPLDEDLEGPEPFPHFFAKAFSFFVLHWAPDIPYDMLLLLTRFSFQRFFQDNFVNYQIRKIVI